MTQLRPVRWLRDHPDAADGVLAGTIAVLAVVFHLTVRDPHYDDPSPVGAALVLVATVPLAWRRRAPGTVLAIVLASQFALESERWFSLGWINVLIAAYTVGAHRSGRPLRWIGGTGTVLVLLFVAAGVAFDDLEWQSIVSTTVLFAAAIILGDNMRRRRERAAELVERAERAERERELVATRRVEQERNRIARELHDVVAHSVSVMIIQAGAARRQVTANPQQAIGVLETIEQTGREAMTEMRRVLGVLRGDDAGGAEVRSPQPSLESLDDLVSSASDLPVSLRREGAPDGLPPGVELSAYRVVQEALTNIRRHAGRVDQVDVAVTHAPHTLVVEITDDGRGGTSRPVARYARPATEHLTSRAANGHATVTEPVDTGYGIAGMRERVGMFGGSLHAGPRQGGGWRVRATFPLSTP